MMLSILLGLAPCPLSIPMPLAFQEAQAANPQRTDEGAPGPMVIQYFHPERAAVGTLMSMMQELVLNGGMDRRVNVGDDRYVTIRPLFLPYGDTLLVRDSLSGMPETMTILTDLDANFVNSPKGPFPSAKAREQKSTAQYTLTHIGVDTAQSALQDLYLGEKDSARPQLSFVKERSQVLVRGTIEQITEAETLLKGLDTPQPRVTLSFFLIQGTEPENNDLRVPADLAADLSALVPYKGYRLLSSAILPSDTSGRIVLRAILEDGTGKLELELQPAAYDESTGTLTLGSVEVKLVANVGALPRESSSFVTSTSLKAGEYTVLGAVGANPVFMVIKLSRAR